MSLCWYCWRWRFFWKVQNHQCRDVEACAEYMAGMMGDL